MRGEPHPECREDPHPNPEIGVEPQCCGRHEVCQAVRFAFRHKELAGEAVPDRHRQRRPEQDRPEEQIWPREKGDEHIGSSLKCARRLPDAVNYTRAEPYRQRRCSQSHCSGYSRIQPSITLVIACVVPWMSILPSASRTGGISSVNSARNRWL